MMVDFPHFSRHASITPQQEKNDAEDDYGEEDPTVQRVTGSWWQNFKAMPAQRLRKPLTTSARRL